MFRYRKLLKLFKILSKKFRKQYLSVINKQLILLLQTFSGSKKRRSPANAGFVLPTVAMVSLVVVLLTTAILFRSFDRAQNASNVRVNEAVLKAATPALDRAKAKISELFSDPTLPRAVPSNSTLYNTLISKLNNYTLGDETPLTVGYDINNKDGIETSDIGTLEDKEIIETAWKFPVDTDNNGKFDSFVLYGIFFRNPPPDPADGKSPSRRRSPLDARTPPMLPVTAGTACDIAGDTSASLVGSSGWYKLPTGELKKSFFVYAVTVPITDKSLDENKYEPYKGNKGFSAIELQQDRSQLPLTNNAVVYEDDLDITPGPQFQINGRIFTNSNLLTGKSFQDITLYQVSSPNSCYYLRENGSIVVGGNVALSNAIADSDIGGVKVDLFKEKNTPTTKELATTNKSTSNNPNQVAYNSQAYAQRIDLLVKAQKDKSPDDDPQEIKDNVKRRTTNDPALDSDKVREEELEVYFKKRTRRVPFIEVSYGTAGIGEYTVADVLQDSGENLRPPDTWVYPESNTGLTLNKNQLPANDPDKVQDKSPLEETALGDRIIVGNNLPELRWENKQFVGDEQPQEISGQKWDDNNNKTRTRTTQVKQLADLGVTERDGFWEKSAASPRANVLDVVGGLRVITGAGVYQRTGSFLPDTPKADNDPTTEDIDESTIDSKYVVWSDAMPMLGFENNDSTKPLRRGDLVMRATAVYHYNKDAYDPLNTTPDYYQTPIACVSSYYDPTNRKTARNSGALPDVSGDPSDLNTAKPPDAKSNNGVSYPVSSTKAQDITRPNTIDGNGLFTAAANADDVANTGVSLLERLKYQANLVFPNGRFVNPLLRQALQKPTDKELTLSEQSAIDSTICAIEIADGTLSPDSTSPIPDGAIKETAFLDARQIKAIDQGSPTGKYELEIEQRQPLEIRATEIDLEKLRKKSIDGTWEKEFLLPNSGIIYATRDDAQPDHSEPNSPNQSATDYKLDPERRPNAIMLINGSDLSREKDYRPEEKGLILATDIPVYVQADKDKNAFNLHEKQEFKDFQINSLSDYANFYNRSDRDPDFACRPNDPRLKNCENGESWRPAAVVADAVTLLSSNFREGFRDEGDYDLRNNQGNANNAIQDRLKNGFWDNNFVTSSKFYLPSSNTYDNYYSDSPTNSDPIARNSSYFNNFVTPIQRRGDFPEYVMEMCLKLPVSECKEPKDWVVGDDIDPKKHSGELTPGISVDKLVAGTTAKPAKPGYERYARRVAFKRDFTGDDSSNPNYGKLIGATNQPIEFNLTNSTINEAPIALGIKSDGKVDTLGNLPNKDNNALWFTTTQSSATPPPTNSKYYNNNKPLFYDFRRQPDGKFAPDVSNLEQPLLEPILQLQALKSGPSNTSNYPDLRDDVTRNENRLKSTRWLPKAAPAIFNLVIAAGDTPSRVGASNFESNGGLHNFVRFLENWDGVNATISGSFIQFKRSIYATAPYQVFVRSSSTSGPTVKSLFNERKDIPYITDSNGTYGSNIPRGEAPYYMAPIRNWGFDVGLLPQNPDLFAQRFVVPPTDPPNEYYREVGRDDRWVKTLLCAVQDSTINDGFDSGYNIKFEDKDKNVTDKSSKFALPQTERPSTCPVTPD